MYKSRWSSWIDSIGRFGNKTRKALSRRKRLAFPKSRNPRLEQFEQRLLLSISPSMVGPDEVEEGALYSVQLTAAGDTVEKWEIDWGDGTQSTGTSDTGWGDDITQTSDGTWIATHCYNGDDVHFVTAKAYDDAESTTAFIPFQPEMVVVRDVAPVLSLRNMGLMKEGRTCSIVLTAADMGGDTIDGWSIDWGDEQTTTAARPEAEVVDQPTLPWWLPPSVMETLNSEGIAQAPAGTLDVGVNGWLSTWGPEPSIYGGDGASLTASRDNVSPDWGNGVVQIGEGRWVVSHTYAEDGDFQITATATDAKGSCQIVDEADTLVAQDSPTSARLAEADASLELLDTGNIGGGGMFLMMSMSTTTGRLTLGGPSEIDEGEVYTLTIAASGLGEGESIDALDIDWGDQTNSIGDATDWGDDIVQNLDGTWTATHVYAESQANVAIVVEATKVDSEGIALGDLFAYHSLIPGDANLDGVVDDDDAAILSANWNATGADWEMGDFNGDGTVNAEDVALLNAHWEEDIDNGGGQVTVNNVIVVTTLDDNPNGNYTSLREALAMAVLSEAPDRIRFDESLSGGGTITLADGQLDVNCDVMIEGLGAALLTIDADGESRAFYVDEGVHATVSGMMITGGSVDASDGLGGYGGAVYVENGAVVTIADAILSGNEAAGDGGAIFVDHYVNETHPAGELVITGSTITENAAGDSGGAIYAGEGAE